MKEYTLRIDAVMNGYAATVNQITMIFEKITDAVRWAVDQIEGDMNVRSEMDQT